MQKEIVGFADGCYDMLHFGHMNGFRQAKMKCSYLIVGSHSEEVIKKEKTEPVLSDSERYSMIIYCRWVNKFLADQPFLPEIDFLMKKYNVTKILHGNDIIENSDGIDCYAEAKSRGMYDEYERTEYISTTILIGRILKRKRVNVDDKEAMLNYVNLNETISKKRQEYLNQLLLNFNLPTILSSELKKKRVVYVSGVFDLLNSADASFFVEAKKLGEILIVGVHSSKDSLIKKNIAPIMNIFERQLNIMGLNMVDMVIPNAPVNITPDFIQKYSINCIAYDIRECKTDSNPLKHLFDVKDNVEVKKVSGSFLYMSSESMIDRIMANYIKYEVRNSKRRVEIVN